MDTRRPRNFRNNFDRNVLDKQVDKIFETGRQFVEGVSGTRPGKKRNSDFQRISRRNVKNVGKWVTDKMEMFFEEEEEDWYEEENNFQDSGEIKSFSREPDSWESFQKPPKRPLDALSLRISSNDKIKETKKLPFGRSDSNDNWPDDLDLTVDRWQRTTSNQTENNINIDTQRNSSSNIRNIPRSRRRRI